MKIESITCHLLSSSYSGTKIHGQSGGLKTIAIIESQSEGHSGLGEAYVGIYVPEITKSIVDSISPLIKGLELDEALDFVSKLRLPFVSNAGIYRSVIGAMEISLFDLKAKIKDVPLYQLFSETAYLPELYISGGSVITNLKDLESDLQNVTDNNIGSFKMRVGKNLWEDDLERVRWVRNLEPNINLMVDAIAGTRTPSWTLEESISRFRNLENLGLLWLEEPLPPENIDEYNLLAKDIKIPIAAGEAYSSLTEFYALVIHGKIDIVQFDVTQSGGINICQKIHQFASSRGRKSAFHVWGSLVAQLANFHLALSMKDLYFFEVPLLKLDLDFKLGRDMNNHLDYFRTIPEKPGIGLNIDLSLIQDYGFIKGSQYQW